MAQLPTTSFAILGLLDGCPMSGYQLSNAISGSIAHFWPVTRTLVYRELSRLESSGLVVGGDVAQDGVPDKREYETTASGREALLDWLSEPGFESPRPRNGLLVKLFFGDRLPGEKVAELLQIARTRAQAARDELDAIADGLRDDPGQRFPWATARYGVAHHEAELAWIDEMERTLLPGEEG